MNDKLVFAAGLTAGVLVATSAGLIAAQAFTTFTAGTPAKASEVNANFQVLSDRITALESKLASVSVIGTTVRFTGVNVQVVNGMGTTATANGTGNLIVGYDEADSSGTSRCSVGTNPNTFAIVLTPGDCTAAGGIQSTAGFKTGSHYLVVGSENNYSRWGGVVFGFQNTSNFDYAGVSGGSFNAASGPKASVSGGSFNTASGIQASVSGGKLNTASADEASVSGGRSNIASGLRASVSGGTINTASAAAASVSGGEQNAASSISASVSGGIFNTASGIQSTVSGGQSCDTGAVANKWIVGGSTVTGCAPAPLGN